MAATRRWACWGPIGYIDGGMFKSGLLHPHNQAPNTTKNAVFEKLREAKSNQTVARPELGWLDGRMVT